MFPGGGGFRLTQLLRCVVEATEVYKLDPFSKTRVVNFLRKLPATSGGGGPTRCEKSIFKCDAVVPVATQRNSVSAAADVVPKEAATSFVCTVDLLENAKLGGAVKAVGIAANPQDAVLAASMHAELLIDVMGMCLYSVPSMQKRHADACRAAGRWAPAHPQDTSGKAKHKTDLPRPLWANAVSKAGTDAQRVLLEYTKKDAPPPPPPVQRAPPKLSFDATPLKSQDELDNMPSVERRRYLMRVAQRAPHAAKSRLDETENDAFQLTNTVTKRVPMSPLIVQSTTIVDPAAIGRVRQWYARRTGGVSMDSNIVDIGASAYGGIPFTTLTLDLTALVAKSAPSASEVPPHSVVACGKASTYESASLLLAMHAELLLEQHHHVEMFADAAMEEERCQLLKDFGRRGSKHHVAQRAADRLTVIAPLKELSPSFNEYQFSGLRQSVLSQEEKFIRYHGEVFNHAKSMMEVNAVDDSFTVPGFDTLSDAKEALLQFQRHCGMRAGFFLTTDSSESFRTTLLLHHLDVAAALSAQQHAAISKDDLASPDGGRARPALPDLEVSIRDVASSTSDSDDPICTMGAMGTGPTKEVAENLCVMHAIEVIARLNLRLFLDDPVKQAKYCEERSKLQLYAPPGDGCMPPHQRLILYKTKREDSSNFSVRLAISASPSFYHSYKRDSSPPPFAEEEQIRALNPLRDFVPIKDDLITEFMSLYTNRIQEFLSETKQRVPEKLIRQRTNKFVPHMLVQDQGSNWRHRSTAWYHLRLPPKGNSRKDGFKTITAVGQACRSKEAERLCFVHLAMLIRHNGVELFTHMQKKESERLLFEMLQKPITQTKPLENSLTSNLRWSSIDGVDTGGYSDTSVQIEIDPMCPPPISKFHYDRLVENRFIFEKIQKQSQQLSHIAVEVDEEDEEN